jgi:cytosine/adenosine deaminase-related metal-dependent hydrolase
MSSPPGRPLTFINAQMRGGIASLRIAGSQIAAVGKAPKRGDLIVDLQGDRLLPGLINAHDHLQLNSLPALRFGGQYHHAREWIADVDAHRRADPAFEASVAVAREERLVVGGLKNLLSGVTTVAHHDRLYPSLSNPNYPIQVVQRYGWSHSLYIDGDAGVRRSYRSTPVDWPWIIHAAEGLDQEAADEVQRLDELGCLRPNTLIVHGVALDRRQRERLSAAGAGLIWCPSSNLCLFGRTAQTGDLIALGRVALGTDSRLSGARDLLEELRVAGTVPGLDEATLESLVTGHSARLLHLEDRGALKVGTRADILILPAGLPLARATRADVRLVLLNGAVRYGDRHYAELMARASDWADVRVDGRAKILGSSVIALLGNARAGEPGLELPDALGRAA